MARTNDEGRKLLKLSESELTLANPGEDIRDRKVFDNAGEEVGTVEDLLADERERKVRFLDVGAGGFLGLGERHFLVPVEAVLEVGADRVVIDHSREKVLDSPPYDPKVVPTPEEQRGAYDRYGYPPFGLGSPTGGG
jgi:sporulation protein YlmC with PRC-barrel domain